VRNKVTNENIRREFDQRILGYELIRKFVETPLEAYKQTSGRGIIRSYTSRIKEWGSFIKNVEEKGVSNERVWKDEVADDILGVRVICLFRSELDVIDGWIKDTFEVIKKKRYEWGPVPQGKSKEEVRKVTGEGYTSIHYIVRLNKADLSRCPKPYNFEIQTRTMLQDAWAEFNHEIYKTKEKIPEEIFRDKIILSKYLSAMNEHFESVRDAYLRSRPPKEVLESKNLEDQIFSGRELLRADFSGCNLRRAKFIESRLLWCDFDGADLSEADFTKAHLSYAKIRNAKLIKTILSGSDMAYADLSRSNLNYANLEKALLTYSDLSYAKFRNAKLRYADLSFAVLKQTSFKEADLRNAHLIYNYYFEEADFEKTDLRDATIVKQENLGEENIPNDVSPHDLYAKCKTCGVEFPVGIKTNPRSFATSTYMGNLHNCPNGHIHSYDKHDYILKKTN
jgi:uncharacterized protein YjbI with pentapeptide repeats